jgi:ABC-2 type transport system permease protein
MSYRTQVLKAFIKKEIAQIIRDKRMRLVLFVAPLMQLMIFGLALSSETRNVRLASISKSGDVYMSDLVQRALSTSWFIPAKTTGNEPIDWINSGQADAVLIAPEGGTGNAMAHGRGAIQLLISAENNLRAQSIEAYLKAILQAVHGTTEIGPSLRFDVRALYNPTFASSRYMVPGVMSMLVCLLTILLTSMAVAREKEIGTIETLTSAPIDSIDLMLGKTIPFIILGSIQLPLVLAFAVLAFDLPLRGPLWMLAISSIFMLASTVSIGLFISTIAKNQQQAMFGGFMYLLPSFLLSGLLSPIENMPVIIQPLAYINPLTHYMGLLRNILLIGGDPIYFVKHTGILLIIAIVIATFAMRRFKAMLI